MSAAALVVHPPAKINLTLHVGPARRDGFHDVRTVMQSIALSDRLTFTPRRGPLTLAVDSNVAAVSADRTNLVWRAAERLWIAAGRSGEPHGVAIRLVKSIPIAAGLGGGSADAAGALAGLSRIWRTRLSRAELMALGADIGSDVPFFLIGGTALGLGRGIEVYPLEDIGRLAVVLVKPPFGVSTAEAYGWLDDDGDRVARAPRAAVDVGWPSGPLSLVNDLEGPVARRHPVIDEIVETLTNKGAVAAAMSGSGSAVFGLFPKLPSSRVVRELEEVGHDVIVTRTLSRRKAARRMGLC